MSIRYLSGIDVDSNTLFVDSANDRVGIGTATPATKLEVYGGHNNTTARLYSTGDGASSNASLDMWASEPGVTYDGSGIGNNVNGHPYYGRRNALLAQSYIRFYNGGILLNTGSTTASQTVTVLASGNVGIGTTSPTARLHVSGGDGIINNAFIGEVPTYTSANAQFSHTSRAGAGEYSFLSANDGETFINSKTGTNIRFRVNNADQVIINSSGNVGIGTTAPVDQLAIGASSSVAGFSVGSGLTQVFLRYNNYFNVSNQVSDAAKGAASIGIGRSSDGVITFWTAAAGAGAPVERMRITNAGNVGIGTTAPGSKLQVEGANPFIRVNNTSADDHGIKISYNGSDAHGLHLLYNANSAVSYIDNTYQAVSGQVYGNIYIRQNVGGTMTSRITIKADGGNVGIGTTSPSQALDVNGYITSSRYYPYNSNSTYISGDTGGLVIQGSGYLYVPASGGSYFEGAVRFRGYIYNDSATYLTINGGTSNVTYFTGNVGIGTTSPAYKLDVIGTQKIGSTAISQGLLNIVSTTTGTSDIFFSDDTDNRGVVRYDHTSDFMSFWSAGSERMRVTSTGNVGIGTTAPEQKLHVDGVVLSKGYIATGNYDGPASVPSTGIFSTNINFADGFGSLIVAARPDAARPIVFATYNGSAMGERMRITSAGDVGIGTASPAAKLQVGGAFKLTGGDWPTGYAGLELNYVTNTAYVGSYDRTNSVYKKLFLFSEDLTLETGAVIRMFITNGGNVLIGTTTDAGYKLRVNGSSYFDAPILCYTGNGYITALTNDGVGSYDGFGYSFLINNTGHEIGRVTGIYETSNSGGSGGLGFWTRGSGTLSSKMTLNSGGTLTLSNYGSGTKTGTPAYNLAVDSSGNIIELPGGVVDGSGTANYVTKWQDANTVTDSQIVDNGTNVGINNASPKTKLDVNGTIGFGSKSMSMTDTFAAALTINMFDHHGCYVKLTAFGDWANHSTIAYLGEFFIQASEGSYNEPGIIIRQVDNTGGGDDIQAQIVDPAGTGTRDFVIQLKATSASNTPFTAYLQYEVRGLYNSVS